MTAQWMTGMRWIGPLRMAFVGSLLLSFLALQGSLINRDGIF